MTSLHGIFDDWLEEFWDLNDNGACLCLHLLEELAKGAKELPAGDF